MSARIWNIAPFSTRRFLFADDSVDDECAEPPAEVEIWIPFNPRPTAPVVVPKVCPAVFVAVPTVWVVVLTRPPTVFVTPPSSQPPLPLVLVVEAVV